MKLKQFILIVMVCIFMIGCTDNPSTTSISTSQTTDIINITFYGIEEKTVYLGTNPLDLLRGISAKDQYNQSYEITVRENINYQVIGEYPISYQVVVDDNQAFEQNSVVHVILNTELNNQYRDELYQLLTDFQNQVETKPYRIIQKTYDPSISIPYPFISEHIFEHFENQTRYTVNTIPEITNEPVRVQLFFKSDQTLLGFLLKGNYLFEPVIPDSIPRKNIINQDSPLLKGIYSVTETGYTVQTTYQDMVTFKNSNDIFGNIYDTYQYNLSKTYSNVEMIFTFSNQVIEIEITFDQLSSDYNYYVNYQIDFETSIKTEVSTLSQVEADSFDQVMLPLLPDIYHEVTYDSIKTRYYKILVSQNSLYELNSNLYNLFEFYDSSYQKLSITPSPIEGDTGYRYQFTSPVEGIIYLKLIRQSRPMSEYFTFYYQKITNE